MGRAKNNKNDHGEEMEVFFFFFEFHSIYPNAQEGKAGCLPRLNLGLGNSKSCFKSTEAKLAGAASGTGDLQVITMLSPEFQLACEPEDDLW